MGDTLHRVTRSADTLPLLSLLYTAIARRREWTKSIRLSGTERHRLRKEIVTRRTLLVDGRKELAGGSN